MVLNQSIKSLTNRSTLMLFLSPSLNTDKIMHLLALEMFTIQQYNACWRFLFLFFLFLSVNSVNSNDTGIEQMSRVPLTDND